MQYKAYRLLDPTLSDTPGMFSGRASVYGVLDLQNDMVMPGAFTKSLQENGNTVKVLVQHDPNQVVGLAELADGPDGLHVKNGQLALELNDAQQVYIRLKNKLIDGISIGYETPEGGAKFVKGVRELHQLKLHEISLVTFPACPPARVTDVKLVTENAIKAFTSQLDEIMTEMKAGRVLSSANAAIIKDCRDASQTLLDKLEKLLAASNGNSNAAGAGAGSGNGPTDVPDMNEIGDSLTGLDSMVSGLNFY